jgi:hypothetical protein
MPNILNIIGDLKKNIDTKNINNFKSKINDLKLNVNGYFDLLNKKFVKNNKQINMFDVTEKANIITIINNIDL